MSGKQVDVDLGAASAAQLPLGYERSNFEVEHEQPEFLWKADLSNGYEYKVEAEKTSNLMCSVESSNNEIEDHSSYSHIQDQSSRSVLARCGSNLGQSCELGQWYTEYCDENKCGLNVTGKFIKSYTVSTQTESDLLHQRPCDAIMEMKLTEKICMFEKILADKEALLNKGLSIEKLRECQQDDYVIATLYRWVIQGKAGTRSELGDNFALVEKMKGLWSTLFIADGLLYRKCSSSDQIVVPTELRFEIFKRTHTANLECHLGVKSTYSRVRKRFFWCEMRADIKLWCRQCTQCAQLRLESYKIKQTDCGTHR